MTQTTNKSHHAIQNVHVEMKTLGTVSIIMSPYI